MSIFQRFYHTARDLQGNVAFGASCTVYEAGTSTLATIYEASSPDSAPVGKSNPFTTAADGVVSFYAVDGQYDVQITGGNVAAKTLHVTLSTGGIGSVKLTDLADTTDAAKNSGMIGFNYALSYGAGTIGKWLKDLAAGTGATFLGYLAPFTGAVVRTLAQVLGDLPASPTWFGASTASTAAANTAAFNAAIAASASIKVPSGVFNLNALNKVIASSFRLSGEGRSTKLVFNTTGDAIDVQLTGGSAQSRTLVIEDIAFGNVTNTPSSFIKISYAVNPRLSRCYFSDASATCCVDNVSGYGLHLRDCVFSDIIGIGYIHRFDAGSVFAAYGCDFTRLSSAACRFENTTASPAGAALFSSCVFEACGGAGVEFNKGVGGGFVWNTQFDGCHFELNTGFDVDIDSNGSVIGSYISVNACTFNGTPQIRLGDKGRVIIVSSQCSGGGACVISGSTSSEARILNSINFTQSGSFYWEDGNAAAVSYTPTVANVTTSSVTGKYKVSGRVVMGQIQVTVSAAPTGTVSFTLPTAQSGNAANVTVGAATATDTGTGYYLGGVWLDTAGSLLKVHGQSGSGNEWNATTPHAWANGDKIDLSFTYFM